MNNTSPRINTTFLRTVYCLGLLAATKPFIGRSPKPAASSGNRGGICNSPEKTTKPDGSRHQRGGGRVKRRLGIAASAW